MRRTGRDDACLSAASPDFARIWGAYTVGEVGSVVGAGALPLIAVLLLNASSRQVSLLAALSDLAIERWRKRPAMIAAAMVRSAALVGVPLAAWAGRLKFAQLCVVGVISSVATIGFNAASGAHLKAPVPAEGRAAASSRFDSTFWLATSIGTPLGDLLLSWLGATVTMAIAAVSYLLSALGVRSIRRPEPTPATPTRRSPLARRRPQRVGLHLSPPGGYGHCSSTRCYSAGCS